MTNQHQAPMLASDPQHEGGPGVAQVLFLRMHGTFMGAFVWYNSSHERRTLATQSHPTVSENFASDGVETIRAVATCMQAISNNSVANMSTQHIASSIHGAKASLLVAL